MFSVIIPALNEAKSLVESNYVELLIDHLNKQNYSNYEIVLVNDGSEDNTSEIFRELENKYEFVKVFTHFVNKGYGSSLKSGIMFSSNDNIVITDIDGTYSPQAVVEIIDIYLNSKKSSSNGLDMVVAFRKGKNLNETLFKSFLRSILKLFVEWSSGSEIKDINSGLRIFSKTNMIKLFPQLSNYFSFTTTSTLAYLSSNMSILYHPIEYLKREGRGTHVRLLRDSLRTLQYVTEATIFYNPLKFFLFLSIGFFILSMIVIVTFLVKKILLLQILSLILLFFSFLSLLFGFLGVLILKVFKIK